MYICENGRALETIKFPNKHVQIQLKSFDKIKILIIWLKDKALKSDTCLKKLSAINCQIISFNLQLRAKYIQNQKLNKPANQMI